MSQGSFCMTLVLFSFGEDWLKHKAQSSTKPVFGGSWEIFQKPSRWFSQQHFVRQGHTTTAVNHRTLFRAWGQIGSFPPVYPELCSPHVTVLALGFHVILYETRPCLFLSCGYPDSTCIQSSPTGKSHYSEWPPQSLLLSSSFCFSVRF